MNSKPDLQPVHACRALNKRALVSTRFMHAKHPREVSAFAQTHSNRNLQQTPREMKFTFMREVDDNKSNQNNSTTTRKQPEKPIIASKKEHDYTFKIRKLQSNNLRGKRKSKKREKKIVRNLT